jgi:hypothetical protein
LLVALVLGVAIARFVVRQYARKELTRGTHARLRL